MHGILFRVGDWLLHFDRVKLLLQAPLLEVGHEEGQILGASRKRLGLCNLARLLSLNLRAWSWCSILVD